jgi:CheY-like chemotaxis protein
LKGDGILRPAKSRIRQYPRVFSNKLKRDLLQTIDTHDYYRTSGPGSYDLIILDIKMPVTDDISLYDDLKRKTAELRYVFNS